MKTAGPLVFPYPATKNSSLPSRVVFSHSGTFPRVSDSVLFSNIGSNDGIIILRNLNDIIPSSLNSQSKVSQREVRTPVEAHQVTPRALELRSDKSSSTPTYSNDGPQSQVTPQRIPDGTYRIKSNAGDLCLTCPQAGTGAVVVQPLNQSSIFQKWTVSLVRDGAYDIRNNLELSLTVGIGAPLLAGQSGTTWTFDPRGDAYVIGNAANAMALQLEPNPPSISVLLRNVGVLGIMVDTCICY
ncbi:hypothetical protein V8E55_001259 [Tylopilus felleus]